MSIYIYVCLVYLVIKSYKLLFQIAYGIRCLRWYILYFKYYKT